MTGKEVSSFQLVTWEDVREEVKLVNKELATIIDKINPGKRCSLIKASYKFGDLVVDRGMLQIRDGNDLLPVSDSKIKSHINDALSYSPIPLTILLNKASEIFVMDGNRVIPLKTFNPGNLFGVFEVLNFLVNKYSEPLWSVSAGSRTIFTLPKISEATKFKHLKSHFDLQSDPPRLLADHWFLFKQIACHQQFEENWFGDMIFFTKDWFNKETQKDTAWRDFHYYLFKHGWIQRQQTFEKNKLSLLWKNIINAISQRRLNPPPYLVDTLKHLFLIALGEAPAFQPTYSDLFAPYKGLQKAILDIYDLKKYSPTIMNATLPSGKSNEPVYYSLSYPTIMEGSPDNKFRSSTLMFDLKDIKTLLDTIVRNGEFLENTFLNTTRFDYFHSDEDKTKEICSSSLIVERDSRFIDKTRKDLEFCATSPFWRGCIKIESTDN